MYVFELSKDAEPVPLLRTPHEPEMWPAISMAVSSNIVSSRRTVVAPVETMFPVNRSVAPLPPKTRNVLLPEMSIGSATVFVPGVPPTVSYVMWFSSAILLPASVKPPPSKVIATNGVPAAKLLVEDGRAAPAGKYSSSRATGATSPTQLAGVAHRLSLPPPSQVATDISVRRSSRSARAYLLAAETSSSPLVAFRRLVVDVVVRRCIRAPLRKPFATGHHLRAKRPRCRG
jgi:hypothetical protein